MLSNLKARLPNGTPGFSFFTRTVPCAKSAARPQLPILKQGEKRFVGIGHIQLPGLIRRHYVWINRCETPQKTPRGAALRGCRHLGRMSQWCLCAWSLVVDVSRADVQTARRLQQHLQRTSLDESAGCRIHSWRTEWCNSAANCSDCRELNRALRQSRLSPTLRPGMSTSSRRWSKGFSSLSANRQSRFKALRPDRTAIAAA